MPEYSIPIWLSDWKFKDARNKTHTIENVVVKGQNKGEIFTNKKIVDKV